MRFRIFAVSVAIVISSLTLGMAALFAQSLADVAREEEVRRKAVKQPAKILTNKDLGSVPTASAPSPATPSTAPTRDAADKTANKDKAAPKDEKTSAPPKEGSKDQAYWSGRVKDLDTQLARDQIFADALQTRINALTADFSARDDPAQREVVGRDRQKAVDELDRLKKAIQTDKKAIADLQEEARRAAVPPGWLR